MRKHRAHEEKRSKIGNLVNPILLHDDSDVMTVVPDTIEQNWAATIPQIRDSHGAIHSPRQAARQGKCRAPGQARPAMAAIHLPSCQAAQRSTDPAGLVNKPDSAVLAHVTHRWLGWARGRPRGFPSRALDFQAAPPAAPLSSTTLHPQIHRPSVHPSPPPPSS